MNSVPNTVVSKDSTRITFDRYGDGPPLIFVDGATADRSMDMSLATVLAPHVTVFAYDQRGRGDSGDTLPFAVEREIEDLDAIIAEAGGSAFVFGHSSGAVLALRAAACGLAIPKLAVYEPPFVVDDSRPPLPGDYVDHINALVAAGRRGDVHAYFMTAAVGIPAEFVEQMGSDPASEKAAHTIAYDGAIMGDTMSGRPLSAAPWNAVTVPALVMDGGESPAWQHNSVRALVAALPNAEHRTLDGQDHGPAADVLAPVLVKFFTR